MTTITPMSVEKRLVQLSREVDDAQATLQAAEDRYFSIKAEYELALAKARLRLTSDGMKMTVQDKADMALLSCEALHLEMAAAEAVVRGARGNAQRIRTQVDIARSVGTSVRSSMDL